MFKNGMRNEITFGFLNYRYESSGQSRRGLESRTTRNLNGTKTLSKVNGMQPEWRKTRGAESSGTNRTISRSETKIDKCLTRSKSRWTNRA